MAQDLAPWFVMIDGEERGPLSLANLSQRVSAGDIDAGTYVWKDGMGEWLPAAQVGDLAEIFAPKPAAARRPPPPPAAAKARKPPKPSSAPPDSHVFRGRDDDDSEEEVLLEIEVLEPPKKPASSPGTAAKAATSTGPGSAVAKSAASPAKAPAASPTPAPSGPKFGGAAKPSSQPYGVPIGEPAKNGRGLPQAPPPPDDEEDVEDWANRTSVEPLPFGERVHQEHVASSLFEVTDPGSMLAVGKTGSYALDMSSWASGEMKSKPPSVESKPAAESAAPPIGAAPSAASAARANPSSRPPSSSGVSRQPTTALRQPLPPDKPKGRLMVALIAGGAVIVSSLGLLIYFVMK